jgi:hypothetical protein
MKLFTRFQGALRQSLTAPPPRGLRRWLAECFSTARVAKRQGAWPRKTGPSSCTPGHPGLSFWDASTSPTASARTPLASRPGWAAGRRHSPGTPPLSPHARPEKTLLSVAITGPSAWSRANPEKGIAGLPPRVAMQPIRSLKAKPRLPRPSLAQRTRAADSDAERPPRAYHTGKGTVCRPLAERAACIGAGRCSRPVQLLRRSRRLHG